MENFFLSLAKEAPTTAVMAFFGYMILNMLKRVQEHYQTLTTTLADRILADTTHIKDVLDKDSRKR